MKRAQSTTSWRELSIATYNTPAAEDLAYGGGISQFLGLPLLLLLNVPMSFFGNSLKGYWITLGVVVIYFVILWTFWRLIGFIKFKKPMRGT